MKLRSGGRLVVEESTKDLLKSVALSCALAIPIGLLPLAWVMETQAAASAHAEGHGTCGTKDSKG